MSAGIIPIAVAVATLLPHPGGARRDAASAIPRAAERRMVRVIGPFELPRGADHGALPQPDPIVFEVPRGGWLTGYDVEVLDSSGAVLPRALLHHAELIDAERRDLLQPRLMRVASVSQDTPELTLPVPLGYPVRRGQRLVVAPMLANPLDRDYVAVLRVTLRWRAAILGVELTSVATFNAAFPGSRPGGSSFDVPPGRTELSAEFSFPVSGRLLALSGHLHEYGERLTFVLLDTGDTLFDGRTARGEDGLLERMPVVQPWGRGGLPVRAGARFRLTAIYLNDTGQPLLDGGMATIGGVFIPDRRSRWPALDLDDPSIAADRRRLLEPAEHVHHNH